MSRHIYADITRIGKSYRIGAQKYDDVEKIEEEN